MTTPLEETARAAILPFEIVEDMHVACGYERSFKMLENRLLANRFLLGVHTAALTRNRLLNACRQLHMPEVYVESFEAQLPNANLVFLGFEDNEGDCIYKVYLEFWENVREDFQTKSNKKEPVLMHWGFKWKISDNTQRAIARYICYPLLSVKEILKRLSNIYEGHEDRTSLEVVEDIVEFAASRNGDGPFMYIEVGEENSPRQSFDINLYRANVRLKEMYSFLSRMRQHYSVPAERFSRLYELVGNKLFGHLSGGVSSEGKDFLTVYYEV